ncbi:MAG: hypothetical protein FJ308_15890 [Planctomycetes bacterium]|nr:hypothetical protein [Planctomycetota bacterium]
MRLLLILVCLLTGCTGGRPQLKLTSDDRNDELGVRVVTQAVVEDSIEAHAEKCEFRGGYDSPETYGEWVESETGGRKYGGLNYELHEKLREAMRRYFQSRPFPKQPKLPGVDDPLESYRAYTYQNFDWFTTNSQIRMQIAGDCLTRELIAAIQAILSSEHDAWGVVLLATASSSFDTEDHYEILVTKDKALIPLEFMQNYPR